MKKGKVPDGMPVSAKGPTSSDVARLAGVSRTQVSYVFGSTGTSHVSGEKRERILAAARELGYRPHQSAQSLRQGFSKEFCIFFPAPYTPRINSIIGTIHETGLAGGCLVTQYSWNGYRDPKRMRDAFEAMLARKPMGIFCSLLDLGRGDIEMARSRGIKVLVLDVERHDDFDTFFLPVEEVGLLAARHLLECGHRRMAVIKPADPVQQRPFLLRLKGMRQAIAEKRTAELTILEWPRESFRPTLAGARAFVETLPGGRKSPTAIYAYSDDYALPLLRALSERGLDVPGDLAILGTDDLSYGEISTPALSTIRFDEDDLGSLAVRMIDSLLTGRRLGEQDSLPPRPFVIQRESTRKGS